MSIRSRVRKLAEQLRAVTEAEQAEKGEAWLRTITDEQLRALAERQKAAREATGDPEATLTAEQVAEVLGMTVEQLQADIEAAWRSAQARGEHS